MSDLSALFKESVDEDVWGSFAGSQQPGGETTFLSTDQTNVPDRTVSQQDGYQANVWGDESVTESAAPENVWGQDMASETVDPAHVAQANVWGGDSAPETAAPANVWGRDQDVWETGVAVESTSVQGQTSTQSVWGESGDFNWTSAGQTSPKGFSVDDDTPVSQGPFDSVQTLPSNSPQGVSSPGPTRFGVQPVTTGGTSGLGPLSPPSGPFGTLSFTSPPAGSGHSIPLSAPAIAQPTSTTGTPGHVGTLSFNSPPSISAVAPSIQQPASSVTPLSFTSPVALLSVSLPAVSPAPGNVRPSLIAARRAQQQTSDLLQPEQDRIYKQYNPHPVVPPPPPPTVVPSRSAEHRGPFDSPAPPAHQARHVFPIPVPMPVPGMGSPALHPAAPSHVPLMGPQALKPVIPSPVSVTGPAALNPVNPITVPVIGRPVQPSGVPFPAPAVGQIQNVPSMAAAGTAQGGDRTVGLRVFCSIGFGGRIVVGGGRFGMRVGLGTIRDCLRSSPRTHQLMSDLETVPSALGTVSPFVTEQVLAQSFPCVQGDRFSLRSLPDSQLLWAYLQSLLRPRVFGQATPRQQFLAGLFELGIRAVMDVNTVLFRFVAQVVAGDLRAAIGLANECTDLFPIAMAIASIHSAEYFRESVLAFANTVGIQRSPTPLIQADSDHILLSVLKTCITAFASTVSSENVAVDQTSLVQWWKVYVSVIASLIKPGSPGDASTGPSFLVRVAQTLSENGNVCAGHLCILLSGRRSQLDAVDAHDAIISVLGADHKNMSHFHRLLDPGPLVLSEAFEYAGRSPTVPFFVPLLPWKFAHASMLASDLGMFDVAERYLEIVNACLRAVPAGRYSSFFRAALRDLEDRIHGSRASGQSTPAAGGGIADAIWGSIRAVAQTSKII